MGWAVGERAVGRGEVDVGEGESAHQAPHVREKSVPHHVREERRRAAEKVDGHRSGHFAGRGQVVETRVFLRSGAERPRSGRAPAAEHL